MHKILSKSIVTLLGPLRMSPGQPGCLGFRDLASPPSPPKKFQCFHDERPGWPGYRDFGFCDRDVGKWDEK